MINWILKKLFGSKNHRELNKLSPVVAKINEIEQDLQQLTDEELRNKTTAWKSELAKIEDPKLLASTLESLLPEAFAVVKNAARRLCENSELTTKWNMIPFDVQLLGGIILHHGKIAEMATGEGKTLVATLAVYLNALTGKGVHVVTANDYLAKRDAEWMGQIYTFLGLSVGVLQSNQPAFRQEQYLCDMTYGTSSEFGFDYLRDNGMAATKSQQVQRGHYFALIDEADSILIDEARTPLIISGPATESSHQYDKFKLSIAQLVTKQTLLCNRLAEQAKTLYAEGKVAEAGEALLKIKLGQPRNKALLKSMENPEFRKLIEAAETATARDISKAKSFNLKEQLYFTIDEQQNEADLTENGRVFLSPDDPLAYVLPDLLTEFADIENTPELDQAAKIKQMSERQNICDMKAERIHNIAQLLKAYCLYENDVEYVVEDGKVIIVDTFTGRKMPGRRWHDGLHQAIEAKEGVNIHRETQTLASITIQNYFRLYEKLAGMTGTAETEAAEFHDIYKLDLNIIPTNKPLARIDENDRIFKTRREKYNAVISAIKELHTIGQPVLVGTGSVEASELVSRMLKQHKLPHTVLNAKQNMREAEIVAKAGEFGAITISTNMAGRGTDIKLGPKVIDLGGLYVIGTERHESRRIDRQLRGRCARQGDPGRSRFYTSFEDDLMRNFGAGDKMTKIIDTFGLTKGRELEHPWLNKSVENAQKRVEQRNYLARKRTLEFDDVMNQQRELIYGYRNEIINATELTSQIQNIIAEVVPQKVEAFIEASNQDGLLQWLSSTFPIGFTHKFLQLETRSASENVEFIVATIQQAYSFKVTLEAPSALLELERSILLTTLDTLWRDHLYAMDVLMESVYLRVSGQKDPLMEYKNDAYDMFISLIATSKMEVLNSIFRKTTNLTTNLSTPAKSPEKEKTGRNGACKCGSGKKLKNCCGRQTSLPAK